MASFRFRSVKGAVKLFDGCLSGGKHLNKWQKKGVLLEGPNNLCLLNKKFHMWNAEKSKSEALLEYEEAKKTVEHPRERLNAAQTLLSQSDFESPEMKETRAAELTVTEALRAWRDETLKKAEMTKVATISVDAELKRRRKAASEMLAESKTFTKSLPCTKEMLKSKPRAASKDGCSVILGHENMPLFMPDEYIRKLYGEKADAASITAEQTSDKYLSLSQDFSSLESQIAKLHSDFDDRLEAQKRQLHLQLIDKDGEVERMTMEMSEMHKSMRQLMELLEHKGAEISEKNSTIKSYLDKFVMILSEASSEKESRLAEASAEIARSQAMCSHISQVEKNDNETSSSLNWHKERLRELETKITSLQEELTSCKDAAATSEVQYNAKIFTANKLVELYKESSEEWSRKAGELEGVIKALETRLSQVENDYKDRLQKEVSTNQKLEKEKEDIKQKLEKCEAEIEKSRKTDELRLAPFSSFTRRADDSGTSNTSEESQELISQVPPGVSGTALAASPLRDGWNVLSELEEKAIREERAEYYEDKSFWELKADLIRLKRENIDSQKEIIDLEKQVTTLDMMVMMVQEGPPFEVKEYDDPGTVLAALFLRRGWDLGTIVEEYKKAVYASRHEELGRKEAYPSILKRVLSELEEKARFEERDEYYEDKPIMELKADLIRLERENIDSQKKISDLKKRVKISLLWEVCAIDDLCDDEGDVDPQLTKYLNIHY